MKRPAPRTVGELAEICQYVTAPETFLELNARALRIRLERHCDGIFWSDIPEDMHKRSVDKETQECFEKIRQEWKTFRDGMIRVFGE